MEDEDEVEVEYPVYASSIDKLFKEQQKLVLLDFPLRPPWRPYDTEHALNVRYKTKSRLLEMKTPAPEAENGIIGLHGKGVPHDSTLCALVKVDDVFTLLSVDEIIHMRPDMSTTDLAEDVDDAKQQDVDYKAPVDELKKGASKPALRAVQVHVKNPTSIDMSMTQEEYIKLISPCTWITQSNAGSSVHADDSNKAAVKAETPKFEPATLQAIREAIAALFEAHSVVNLGDVRSWLSAYQPKPAARNAATAQDSKLHELLVEGASVTCIRGKYMLTQTNNPASDTLRALVLELLEHSTGLKKADVMNAAKLQGMDVSEHLYNKVVKDICVAQGAVWSLKNGAYS